MTPTPQTRPAWIEEMLRRHQERNIPCALVTVPGEKGAGE